MANTKIRTEDVVEILDTKIKTSSAHAQLDVAVDEFYDSVLSKIAARSPTLDEKDALDNTTYPPSATNPYVTVDELATVIDGSIPWKTIGQIGSGADFEGNDETPFLAAFATVPTDIWFLVMAGTYTFTGPVTIPTGVRLAGAHTSSTILSSAVGGVFILADDVYISYLNLISTDVVNPAVTLAGTTNTEIRNCMISATDTSQTVDVAGATNFSMSDTALFFGTLSGVGLTTSSLSNIYVDTAGVEGMSLVTPSDVVIWGSTFIAGTFVIESGTNIRVVGNHFNNAISNTTPIDSVVFRANTPSSNNNEDDALTALLQYLGSPSSSQNTPSYSNNFAGPQAQNLTARASALDLLLQWKYEERNMSLIAAYDRDDDIEIAQGEITSVGPFIGHDYEFAQTFIPPQDGKISEVQIYFNEIGTRPDCNILVMITEVSGGEPTTILGSSNLIPTSSIVSGGLNTIPLSAPVAVDGVVQYSVNCTLQDYEETIDHPTGSIGTVNLDTDNHQVAQSLTPSVTGVVNTVTIGLGILGSLVGTEIVVELVEMFGGEPTGTSLGTSDPILVSTLVVSPAHGDVEFTYATPVPVTAGTDYAFVLRYVIPSGSTIDALNQVQCSYDPAGTYSNGQVYTSDDFGTTWASEALLDLTFTTTVYGYDPANYLEVVGSTTSVYADGNLFTDMGVGTWTGDVNKDINMIVDFTSTEVLLATWEPSTNTLATSRDMYLVSAHRDARWLIPEISPTVIPEGEFLYYILDRSLSGGTGDITLTPNVAPIGSFPLETNPPTGHPDNRQIVTLAFNHGGTLWWRGGGGTRFPSGVIGDYFVDGTSKNLLTYLGALDYNDSDPNYSHNFAGAQGESLTMRLSHSDTLIKRLFEHSNLTHYLDDNSFLSSEGVTNNLTLTGILYFSLPHKTGRMVVNPQSWTLADGELLYFSWDHTLLIDQVVGMGVATTVPLPDENLTTKYFVVAKRVGGIITLWDGTRLPDGGKWPVPKGRQVVPTGAPATLKDNIVWDGTDILWEKWAIVCDGITLNSNLFTDQTTPLVGLTDLVDGEGLLITHTWLEQSPSSKYVTIEKVVLPLPLLESNQFLWVQIRDNYLIIT
jgi:hypothetical protein